ncbi:MAG: response regulator, partial [Vallitaleaceae bacterium]|nr:response regulator [Vallitaleaceae bacterium]
MQERMSILICDDSNENIVTLVEVLEDKYELYIVTTAEDALTILKKVMPDIILLDVLMPGMNGYELCEIIKSKDEFKDTPVIFISGMVDNVDKQKGFAVGAVDYVTKPFNVEEVQARVKAQVQIVKHNHRNHEKTIFLEKTVKTKENELEIAYNKLKLAYIETIEKLSTAAEYKDDVTGLHVKRVGRISAIIARGLGLDDYFIKAIEYAAPLHDIGKIGIPEAILLKPGKLDEDEWEKMKTHTIIGKNILEGSSSDIINLAETIAYTHHEKWDGTGYPLGLKGIEIPMESRIVAIADVYDAITSVRSY